MFSELYHCYNCGVFVLKSTKTFLYSYVLYSCQFNKEDVYALNLTARVMIYNFIAVLTNDDESYIDQTIVVI